MRIAILDGSPEAGRLSEYLGQLVADLRAREHDVRLMTLRDMDIKFCTGCWSCWWKTPGECAFDDDSRLVCANIVNSDVTVMASPLVAGFVSALLKKTQDKTIPLMHPYARIVGGESHHVRRYRRYPSLVGLIECARDTDDEDLAIATHFLQRYSIDLAMRLYFVETTHKPAKEMADAVDRIQWLAAR